MFAGCPDKEDPQKVQELLMKLNPKRKSYIQDNGLYCTADIRLINDENEEIYLEFKQIPFAFETSKEIGNSKAYERIMNLICETFDIYEEYADIIREEYIIRIKEGYIPEYDVLTFYEKFQITPEELNKEIIEFVEAFSDYVFENKNKWSIFEFKRKKNIVIEFVKKESNSKGEKETVSENHVENTIVNQIAVLGVLIEKNGFLFDIPINICGAINANEYFSILVDSDKLIEKMFINFKKAQNSFYGIDKQRYLIHDVFFKYNNDSLYVENGDLTIIGNALISNIQESIASHIDEINQYKEYFDKSYLFVTLEDLSCSFELF